MPLGARDSWLHVSQSFKHLLQKVLEARAAYFVIVIDEVKLFLTLYVVQTPYNSQYGRIDGTAVQRFLSIADPRGRDRAHALVEQAFSFGGTKEVLVQQQRSLQVVGHRVVLALNDVEHLLEEMAVLDIDHPLPFYAVDFATNGRGHRLLVI